MADPIYRPSRAEAEIVVLAPIGTATTIEIYGSGDEYAEPSTIFGDDEEIMVAGTVIADDGADLSLGTIIIRVNGTRVGTTGLSYDSTTGINYYQFPLGLLPLGEYTIQARFRRLRIW